MSGEVKAMDKIYIMLMYVQKNEKGMDADSTTCVVKLRCVYYINTI